MRADRPTRLPRDYFDLIVSGVNKSSVREESEGERERKSERKRRRAEGREYVFVITLASVV